MGDMSKLSEKIFWGANNVVVDLYLRGEIPDAESDFGISFNGEYSVVPFRVYDFATKEIGCSVNSDEIKGRLDRWAEGGVWKIDRFLFGRDLTTALKKGDNLELFVEFPDNANWIGKGSFYIPADSVKKYSVCSF
ncbi:hypothetical protein K8R30_01135 [archaeon]|nr:hypothetical protein [archaeon]